MGEILIRKQDCCNRENTLISETQNYLKIKQKKVSFYRVFYGNQREAEYLERMLDKQGEMTRRVWQENISLVSNFQETLIRRCNLFLFVCFWYLLSLGGNLLQGPVARWEAWLKFGQKKTKQRVIIGQLRTLCHYYWGLFWELNGSYYAKSWA